MVLTMTVDTPDVALPTDCHIILKAILYPGLANEVEAIEVPWMWDYRIKQFPSHYGPDPKRPMFALKPGEYSATAVPASRSGNRALLPRSRPWRRASAGPAAV